MGWKQWGSTESSLWRAIVSLFGQPRSREGSRPGADSAPLVILHFADDRLNCLQWGNYLNKENFSFPGLTEKSSQKTRIFSSDQLLQFFSGSIYLLAEHQDGSCKVESSEVQWVNQENKQIFLPALNCSWLSNLLPCFRLLLIFSYFMFPFFFSFLGFWWQKKLPSGHLGFHTATLAGAAGTQMEMTLLLLHQVWQHRRSNETLPT